MKGGEAGVGAGRGTMGVAIGLTWAVMALVVVLGAWQLREQVREQIVARDGEILLAYARTVQADESRDEVLAEDPLVVMVEMAKLQGIFAARLYTAQGEFVTSLPVALDDDEGVPSGKLEILKQGLPVSRFQRDFQLTELSLSTNLSFWRGATNDMPVVEVWVPLTGRTDGLLRGVAGFLIDGAGVAREFARLDARLGWQTVLVLGVAFGVTGAVIGWSFRRLERSLRLLARRTEDLQRANQELARSARVAALGAVTAHLIHGLRNPVSGLQSFIAAGPETGGADEVAWEDARVATRRMQALIEQVVGVLREHESDLAYEVTLRELAEAVVARVRGKAEARGVALAVEGDPPPPVDNRRSGLLALILTNLVENGIEASSRGGSVRLRLAAEPGGLVVEVADAGLGLGPETRERLFQPQRSTKEGGSGLGLAITHQLALALGGRVGLLSTGSHGTVFRVDIPLELPAAPSPATGSA